MNTNTESLQKILETTKQGVKNAEKLNEVMIQNLDSMKKDLSKEDLAVFNQKMKGLQGDMMDVLKGLDSKKMDKIVDKWTRVTS